MLWLELIGVLAMQGHDLYASLGVFQQCHYHLDRYRNWIADEFSIQRVWKRIQLLLPFLLLLFLKVEEARSPSVFCFTLIYLYVQFQRLKDKKRSFMLRFTNRMCRFSICLLLLTGITIIGMRYTLSYELYICCLPLLWMIPWILLPIASYVVLPMEHMIQNSYVQDAKARLNACPQMIRVGISGSYGKTSVKYIAYALLKDHYYTLKTPHSYNNRMGITRTIREELDPLHEVFLCEMGSDHSGELAELLSFVQPKITIVTAIGPQHLKTFGSQEAIVEEKMKMVEMLPPEGIGILNVDNPFICSYPLHTTANIYTYGYSKKANVRIISANMGEEGTHFVLEIDHKCYPFHTRLLGECNILNITAAITLARILHVPMADLQQAVEHLPFVEHRLEMKKMGADILIDDAYNSNLQGALAACRVLKEMPNWRVIITPGFMELGELQQSHSRAFGEEIAKSADEVVLVGKEQTKEIYGSLIEQQFPEEQIHVCGTMQEAITFAKRLTSRKKTILIENDIPDIFNHEIKGIA